MVTPRLFLVALLPFLGSAATLTRMACGGSGGMDTAGVPWLGEAGYSGGYSWTAVNQPSLAPLGPPYNAMRASLNGAPFKYSFIFAPGAYKVTLEFAEPNKTAKGQRVFTVSINGAPPVTIDLFASAGAALTPWNLVLPVTTADGNIVILFSPVSGNALVSGIQVDGQAPALAPVWLSGMGPVWLSGLASAMPAACATGAPQLFFTTDTHDVFACLAPGPWIELGIPPASTSAGAKAAIPVGPPLVGTVVNGQCQAFATGFHPVLKTMVSNEVQANCLLN